MSPEPDEGLAPTMIEQVARIIGKTMHTVGATPPEGCAILALAYAIWVEEEPAADPHLLRGMLRTSERTAIESFRILRLMRGQQEELLAAAGFRPS